MGMVVGVDAGGTGTRAVLLVDAADLGPEGAMGRVAGRGLARWGLAGRGVAGPGNPGLIGPAAAAEQVRLAVAATLTGHDARAVTAVGIGIAGISAMGSGVEYRSALASLGVTVRPSFHPDAVTAFAAGSTARDGLVLIAGTGAVAARIKNLQIDAVADGLGWLVGDEGSGLWLGLQAVRRAARSWSPPSSPSPLVRLVAAQAAAASPDDLVAWANDAPRAGFAALAPGICALAAAGDPDARALVDSAVTHLLSTLSTVDDGGPLVLAGGLLGNDTEVRTTLVARLAAQGRPATVAGDPALGAAALAAAAPVPE
jgi:N-acetylglucosamine kinase-like BadF-type ATPase